MTLKFKDIQNESQLDHIVTTAESTGCCVITGPFFETAEVKGNPEQIAKFRKKYME